MDFSTDGFLQFASRIWNYELVAVGDISVTLSILVSTVVGFIIAVVLADLFRRLVMLRLLQRTPLERGVQFAVARITYYIFVTIGVLVVLDTAGVNLASLSLFGGLLGVGIGFGLQNISANFISGVILLIERPVRVGDVVTVDDLEGQIMAITMRVTQMLTFDNIMVYVPNSRFIDGTVINWTSEDLKVRVHVNVGVAYGSDTKLVKQALLEAASEHPEVLGSPEPQVWFLEFGDSSLNFRLLVWVPDPLSRFRVESDLHFAVDDAFREHGIEIPFPQRDLHLRSAVVLPVEEGKKGGE